MWLATGLLVRDRKTTFHQFSCTFFPNSVNFCKVNSVIPLSSMIKTKAYLEKKTKHADIRYNKTVKKRVEQVIYAETAWNFGTERYFVVYLGLCGRSLNTESPLWHSSITPRLWGFFFWPCISLQSTSTGFYFIICSLCGQHVWPKAKHD